MKTETKQIHICEHCNKWYQNKGTAKKHEKMCFKNPENKRPCLSCPLLQKRDYTIYYDTGYGEQERKVQILYCEYKKQYLHTPQSEIKGNAFDLGDEINHPMPKECDVDLNKELNIPMPWDF